MRNGALLTLSTLVFATTSFTAVSAAGVGTRAVAGQPIAEHCLVGGQGHQRIGTVDGQTCAIGFQMRLPMVKAAINTACSKGPDGSKSARRVNQRNA